MNAILQDLSDLDWTDVQSVSAHTHAALAAIFTDRSVLHSLIGALLRDSALLSLCEHYDFFDKLVLYKDPTDSVRVRLHMFLPGASHKDRPHNHRWSYSSVILHGSYHQLIYGTDASITETTPAQSLIPLLEQLETPGAAYTLASSVFHSVAAEPYTVSLMIRGPAVSDRFLVLDKRTNRGWWEYGRESEAVEETRRKTMLPERLRFVIHKLNEMGI